MAVVILIFCLGASLQAQPNPPKITLVPVAGPVFMLQGGGGNIGIVADAAGMFMIDAMFERAIGEIRAEGLPRHAFRFRRLGPKTDEGGENAGRDQGRGRAG
jgi:hypothetical protein